MGRQGLVSVVEVDGSVVIKAVATVGGEKANQLKKILKDNWPMEPEEVFRKSIEIGFGRSGSLVVVSDKDVSVGLLNDLIGPYVETFNEPGYNPSCINGHCDNIAILQISKED